MKVSIITASYNSADHIANCLDSVFSQTYPNIEHVIVDGFSNDGTLDIINSTNNKVSCVISEPDNGVYDALNKGIKFSSGDLIGFLHSDDIFASEEIISDVVKAITSDDYDGVYGDLIYVKRENVSLIMRYWKGNVYNFKSLKFGWMPAHPTLFLRREIYDQFGDYNLDFKISADYDFILRVFRNKSIKFLYIPKIITVMRLGGISNRGLNNILLKTVEDFRAAKLNHTGGLISVLFKNLRKLNQLRFFVNRYQKIS